MECKDLQSLGFVHSDPILGPQSSELKERPPRTPLRRKDSKRRRPSNGRKEPGTWGR